jgi:hypothetical protein
MRTWDELVEQEPRLRRFEQEAVEAAGNGWLGWYGWVRTFGGLSELIPDGGRQVILDHLKAVYHGERERLLQAARPQLVASPASRPTSPQLRPERRRR